MASKYYAVKKGKVPGIYLNWNDCKAMVDGYTGAVYKSFKTIEEAEKFINGEKIIAGEKTITGMKSSGENMTLYGSLAAVERHLEAVGVGMALEEDLCRPLRPHGVAARRSFADSEYFFDGFHVGRGKIQFGDGGKRQARSSQKGQARSL